MSMSVHIDCLWLPPSHGGRRSDPHPGLRLGIRWQRHIQEHTELYRDIQFERLTVDPSTRQGIAVVRLTGSEPVPSDWLHDGELVELLEGFQVVAVGRITHHGSGEPQYWSR